MQYTVKDVKEELDIIQLTKSEFDSLNKVYKLGLTQRGFRYNDKEIPDMKRIIMTDGYYRMEFTIEVTS